MLHREVRDQFVVWGSCEHDGDSIGPVCLFMSLASAPISEPLPLAEAACSW
jgi:hypothetical protein